MESEGLRSFAARSGAAGISSSRLRGPQLQLIPSMFPELLATRGAQAPDTMWIPMSCAAHLIRATFLPCEACRAWEGSLAHPLATNEISASWAKQGHETKARGPHTILRLWSNYREAFSENQRASSSGSRTHPLGDQSTPRTGVEGALVVRGPRRPVRLGATLRRSSA